MRALVTRDYGPMDALEITDLPVPRLRPGDILLRTEAASLNGVDAKLITGEMGTPAGHPFVPGVDVAGVVESVGPDVSRFRPGDKVPAALGVACGAMAEFSVAPDEPRIAQRPAGLSAADAAALATGAMTAVTILEAAKVRPDETVLVVGATGGVGSFTVQMARRAAKSVYATGG